MSISWKHFHLPVLAVLAVAMAGCVPHDPQEAPVGEMPQATEPALPAMSAQGPYMASGRRTYAHVPTLEQQKVRLLIRQVESAYALGNTNYRRGKLLEAKQQFDRAVDLMLTCGIDIKSNPELQDEFDRIVDGVNALETEALKQGNGFVPKEEPTPGEVASEVTFQVDPNIVARAKAELATTKSDLPIVVNDYVAAYINFFAYTQRGHNTLLHSFQRAGRYKAMIQRVMAEENVPQDLIYLAVAESGFNPRALNRSSGAGGMWQFMPHGNYGLTRNAYVDERFDPEKSTRAYARYMKFIYNQTGDWYLSMAGYNWGTGNVQRAVQKTGYADFWELYKRHNLPAETQNYVPEILAAIIIANHPAQYGFDDVKLDLPVLTDTVTINYQVDLHLVSDLVGAPMEELMALNPSLLHSVTPPDTSFDLHLPAGTATLFTQRMAAIPEGKRLASRYHRVISGETLASVAHEHHLTAAELAAANQLGEGDSLQGIEGLIIPQATATVTSSVRARYYTVHRGDTLVTIADRFGISLNQLRHWNRISGTRVKPGRHLRVGDITNTSHAAAAGSHRQDESQAGESTREDTPVKSAPRKSTTVETRDKSDHATSRDGQDRSSTDVTGSRRSGKKNARGVRNRDQESADDSNSRDQVSTKHARGKSRHQATTRSSRSRDRDFADDSSTRDQGTTKHRRGKSRDQDSSKRSRSRDRDSADDSSSRDQVTTKHGRGKSRDQAATKRSRSRDKDSADDSSSRDQASTKHARSKSRDQETTKHSKARDRDSADDAGSRDQATTKRTRGKSRDQEPATHAKSHARRKK
jgi:membrane-bound lytic murein transglycosylase D